MSAKFRPTPQERAILNALRSAWPREAAYPLDSAADRQFEREAKRLIDAGVVRRYEKGEMAVYGLQEGFLAEIGGTPRPEDN